METCRRKRRSAEDIEKTIFDVATQSIKEKGFNKLTVTGIMQKASIEAIQFYNRYNDLNSFIDEYVKRFDYWFSEVVKSHSQIADNKEEYENIINGLFDSLWENKIMQELLKWELSTNNEISQRTAKLRELHTLPLCSKFDKVFTDSEIDIVAISALIISGIYYLILHNELSPFGGIDLHKEEDRSRMHKAIHQVSELLFNTLHPNKESIAIAKAMKQDNMPFDKIAKYTKLSEEVIASL